MGIPYYTNYNGIFTKAREIKGIAMTYPTASQLSQCRNSKIRFVIRYMGVVTSHQGIGREWSIGRPPQPTCLILKFWLLERSRLPGLPVQTHGYRFRLVYSATNRRCPKARTQFHHPLRKTRRSSPRGNRYWKLKHKTACALKPFFFVLGLAAGVPSEKTN